MVFFFSSVIFAQPYLNLDFESAARGQLWNWWSCASQYECVPDSTVHESGTQSLRIDSLSTATSTTFGASAQYLPLQLVAGHHLEVSGWMKTSSVREYAAIWLRVDGSSGVLSFDDNSKADPRGTTGWKQYSFERDVSPAAVDVMLGLILNGTGTAWFDNLAITIDGVPFNQGPAPNTGEPTAAQLDWVQRTAIPLAGVDPSLSLDDLSSLKNLIGDAHVVALGEDTHGTSEFFRLKHRIIEYLASQMGFTVFAIQVNMPEAYAVNDYVMNGNGDPKQLLSSLNSWTTNAQEVLDMIQWMRAFNQSGQGQILFTGFDMLYPDVPASNAQSFMAKADADFNGQLSLAYKDVQTVEQGIQDYGMALAYFPVTDAAGKQVHYTAYIKTQNITTGCAGLWWSTWDASGSQVASGNGSAKTAAGTTNWTQYAIDVTVPKDAVRITFGAFHQGNGTAWFDAPAITLNGVPYAPYSFVSFYLVDALNQNDFTVTIDSTTTRTGTPTVRSNYIGPAIPSKSDLVTECHNVVDHMRTSRSQYLDAGFATSDVDWAIQNASLVAQYADYQNDPATRDAAMAANIEWILGQAPPGTKMVIWAHNQHVDRAPGAMGAALAAQYGDDYRAVGFAFHDGQYNADGAQGLAPYNAVASFPGSAEYVLHASGLSPLILDLRQSSLDDPASGWVRNEIMFRNISETPADGFDLTSTLAPDFDGLVYVEQSTPSQLLPF
jgi:erythromycin esterase-like protein